MSLLNEGPIRQHARKSNFHKITYLIDDFNQVDKLPNIFLKPPTNTTSHDLLTTYKKYPPMGQVLRQLYEHVSKGFPMMVSYTPENDHMTGWKIPMFNRIHTSSFMVDFPARHVSFRGVYITFK